jgi:hypothetical protein
MLVDVIKPSSAPAEGDTTGHWEWVQDPDSGGMVQVWVTDNPNTPEVEGHVIEGVRCLARATGIRPEQFNAEYLNEEWVKVTVAANANITLRDKLTNIRTYKGQLIWTEEESDGNPATTFDVFRVSPVIDGFGNVVEKAVLAKRAEVQ